MSDEKKKTTVTGDAGSGKQISIETDLAGNSHKSKTNYSKSGTDDAPETVAEERVKMASMVKNPGKRKKKRFGAKLREAITEDDAQSVGDYLLFDVIVPAFKAVVSDVVSQGTDRVLYGAGKSSPRGGRGRGEDRDHVPYGRISTSRPRDGGRRELSRQDRATHTFDSIIVDTRNEADDVIFHLQKLVKEYGSARLTDLYDMVDISGEFTDDRWGWFDLSDCGHRRVRDGYLLLLPKPEPL